MREKKWVFKAMWYRPVMRLAHYFNWHYAPPIYPEGDTQLWCKWCGFRQTIRHHKDEELKQLTTLRQMCKK